MPKRVGQLMPRIASLENLHEAFLRAARGKSGKRAVIDFRSRLDENLVEMGRQLLDGTFRFGQYQWFAKLDICKYFDSIDHHVLLRQLCRLFKDPQLLMSFSHLLDSYETSECRGLPIGNLTSQYFANHYLAMADHYMKEQVKVPAMVRYMDDILIFSSDKTQLLSYVKAFCLFAESELRLAVHEPVVNQTRFGVPFLGYIVYSDRLRLNHRSRVRFCKKMDELTEQLHRQRITERVFAMRASCLHAFIDKADSADFRFTYYHSNASVEALTA